MKRIEVEQLSRPIPYSAAEIAWIRNRPLSARAPLPHLGDRVLFRLDEWAEVYEATVDREPILDDVDDPHLFQVETDPLGEVVLLEGRPILSALDDPWPTVYCVVEIPTGDEGFVRRVHTHSREARLRGAAGWLPVDWETRRRPLPTQLEEMVS